MLYVWLALRVNTSGASYYPVRTCAAGGKVISRGVHGYLSILSMYKRKILTAILLRETFSDFYRLLELQFGIILSSILEATPPSNITVTAS